MSRPPVRKIMPVSATVSFPPVEIGQTNSISDPDVRWVAKRQGEINEAFEKLMRLESDHSINLVTPLHDRGQDAEVSGEPVAKLSGESDRIGRIGWDADTAFGKHVGFF